jgi:hypothetical protein
VGSPYTLGGKGAGAIYCFGGAGHELRWTAKEKIGYHLSEISDMDGDSVSDLLANVGGEIVALSGAKGTRVDVLPATGAERWGPLAAIEGPEGVCVVTALLQGARKRMGVSCISLRSKKEVWTVGASDLGRMWIGCVAAMPDRDHDGVEEVLVGCADRVVCLSGATGKQLFQTCGASGDRLGFSLVECGDWNGDRVSDFVAGAPKLDGPGYACVCSGQDGAILSRMGPESKLVGFGYSVASVPAGAGTEPRSFLVAESGDSIGELFVYLCSPREKQPRLLCAKGPVTDFNHLVRSIGDQDGDGLADFAATNSPPAPDCMEDGSVGIYSSKDGKELCVLRRPAN